MWTLTWFIVKKQKSKKNIKFETFLFLECFFFSFFFHFANSRITHLFPDVLTRLFKWNVIFFLQERALFAESTVTKLKDELRKLKVN